MKILLSVLFVLSMVGTVTSQSTVVCPESSVKCKVTRTFADGSSETVESEKGADRGAIEIKQ